jgi:hypothetical protein
MNEETNELPDYKYRHRPLAKIPDLSRYPFSRFTSFPLVFLVPVAWRELPFDKERFPFHPLSPRRAPGCWCAVNYAIHDTWLTVVKP